MSPSFKHTTCASVGFVVGNVTRKNISFQKERIAWHSKAWNMWPVWLECATPAKKQNRDIHTQSGS